MTSPINGLGSVQFRPTEPAVNRTETPAGAGPGNFHTLLQEALAGPNGQSQPPVDASEALGLAANIERPGMAMADAQFELSLEMMRQFNDRLLEAYAELKDMRM